jgi:O-antigen/teichoic acid export membrane protein
MAHLHGEGDQPKFRNISGRLFVVIAVATGIALGYGLAFNGSFVSLWVGAQFYAGTEFNLLYGLATAISIITFTLMEVLFATGNIRGPAIAQLLVSAARIALLLMLVPQFGMLSIPLSLLLAEAFGGLTYLAVQWKTMLLMSWQDLARQFLVVARVLVIAVGISWLWVQFPAAAAWRELFLRGVLFGVALMLAIYLAESSVRSSVNGVIGRLKGHAEGRA